MMNEQDIRARLTHWESELAKEIINKTRITTLNVRIEELHKVLND